MPEGKRYTPESPSPAMKSFAEYIREQGYNDATDLVTTVAATFVYHRKWQEGHAQELVTERAAAKAQKEIDNAAKKEASDEKKRVKAEEKAEKDRVAAEKKATKEREKAEKEAAGADGDDSDSPSDGETARPRARLRTRTSAEEPVTAGVSEQSF